MLNRAKSNSNSLIFSFPLSHHIGKSPFLFSTYRGEVLQQLDFFLSSFPPPVTWGQPVIHIFSFFPLPRSPPLLSPTPSSPPQPAMTSAVLPPLFPRAAGKGKAVVPDCLVAPSAPRVAPASGGFMAEARRPPPPRRHAPKSPPPPRRPAPRENQSVGIALSGQTPHPQTSHLHS